ncbi:MAG: hypothetical protein H6645_04255 [Caldilineaceae bacterium]|nr:hypothetical protein [Caldilineaceae bacterium]
MTEPAQAKKFYEQSPALYREVGDQPNVAGLSNLLGTTLRDPVMCKAAISCLWNPF